jgi:hypothetical protein
MQGREAVAVEPLLHAGNPLIVDVHQTNQVRHGRAVRIRAFVFVQESDARQAQAVNLLLLLRGDLTLEPGKAAPAIAEPVAHFLRVEVRHHGGQQFHRLVHVDQPLRLAEQRGHAHVCREDFAVAVEDIGPRRRGRVASSAATA